MFETKLLSHSLLGRETARRRWHRDCLELSCRCPRVQAKDQNIRAKAEKRSRRLYRDIRITTATTRLPFNSHNKSGTAATRKQQSDSNNTVPKTTNRTKRWPMNTQGKAIHRYRASHRLHGHSTEVEDAAVAQAEKVKVATPRSPFREAAATSEGGSRLG